MLQSIPVVDETNYRLWELIQKIMWFHILLARNRILTVTNHQPRQANKRQSSLGVEVKLCLTMFFYHLFLLTTCTLPKGPVNPAGITQLTQSEVANRKTKLHLHSATSLYCNSNPVPLCDLL